MQAEFVRLYYADWLLQKDKLLELVKGSGLPHELVDVMQPVNLNLVVSSQVGILPELWVVRGGVKTQAISTTNLEEVRQFLARAKGGRDGKSPVPVYERCLKGHTLQLTTVLPLAYRDGFYTCDICQKLLRLDGRVMLHCPACNYDICSGCGIKY